MKSIIPYSLIFFLLFSCKEKEEKIQFKQSFFPEYQKNNILIDDISDKKLMLMDTILYFSDIKNLYEVEIKHKDVVLTLYNWKDLPDNKYAYQVKGFQKNGFIYTKDEIEKEKYSLSYKILLNKGLFVWDGQNWVLINSGKN